jgi:hypothetical protein
MREFKTGATRDSDNKKLDYEGFLSPIALKRYAEYLHKHRTQADGQERDSDNWQKGMPIAVYMKSLLRHVIEMWTFHRETLEAGWSGDKTEQFRDIICAVIFNAFGYLFEDLKLDD